MWFMVSKTLLSLILPPAGPLVSIAAGFLIVKPCRNLGRFMIATGFLALYALSISPVAYLLLQPLETAVTAPPSQLVKADAIVVLAAGVRDRSWLGMPSEPSSTSYERMIEGITIYRKRRLPLVFVGGNGDPWRKLAPEADAMAASARGLGVPARDILVENSSRNTLEGARALKSVITGTRIVLVTSASHMKRAAALFAKQGFTVVPAPAGYRAESGKLSLPAFIPRAGNLEDSSTALSEYISYCWYSLSGAI